VIECDPLAKVEMLKVAFPLLIVPVPSDVVPSLKVIAPLLVKGVRVAVNFTDPPNTDGFADDATVTLEFALLTTCVRAEEALLL
jgi:hypothetical protein